MAATKPQLGQLDLPRIADRLQALGRRLPLDQWAERFRIVSGQTPFPGRWDWRNAPQAREPMRAFSHPAVREVALMAPTQLLKSEFAINVALHTSMHGDDCLFWEPNETLASEFLTERIRPSLRALDPGLISGANEGLKTRDTAFVLRLAGGGTVRGVTPKQRSGVTSRSARVAVIDEIDKMGDPRMHLFARSRTTVYESDARTASMSSPTLEGPGTIWSLWAGGSRGRWCGRCRHCGDLVLICWDHVRFERDPAGNWLPETARFICPECGAEWSEADRLAAARAGGYIHADPDCERRTFWVHGAAHLWRSLRDIVQLGADAYRGALEEGLWGNYEVWKNEFLGEPWSPDDQGLSARRLQGATVDMGARSADTLGILDDRAQIITAGADVGAREIYVEWVAWGVDPQTMSVMSWALRYQTIGGGPDDDIEDPELWRELERLLTESRWRHPRYPGATFDASRAIIDAGYRPELVRAWCSAQMDAMLRRQGRVRRLVTPYAARWLPSKSKSIESGKHPVDLTPGLRPRARPSQVDRYPALVSLESNQLKDAIYESLLSDRKRPDGAEPANNWPDDFEARGYLPWWFDEFTAEVKRPHRQPRGTIVTRWERKRPGEAGYSVRNEAWDCRVYAYAAALVEVWASPLRDGLVKMALRDAVRPGSGVSERDIERLRSAVAELEGYSS